MQARPKTIAIVAPHFLPSNLASVHRARLWAQHLPEFGWKPIIVTTHWRHYEEKLDWELMGLLDPELEVVRTWAAPTKPLRVVGDIGVRGFYGHYRALCDLAEAKRIDFLHITIPSNYSALLGPLIQRRYGIPFGIDYIDPWVHSFPGSDVPLTKAWGAARLANVLEPHAVADARLITGVADGYFEAVLERNPHLRDQAVLAAMPYGASELDYQLLARSARAPYLFDANDGRYHVIYAGALLPKSFVLLERLFEAVASVTRHEEGRRLRLHFVGTGSSPNDPRSGQVRPYIDRFALSDHVVEHAARISYVDVLNHLSRSGANLVLGSTERHYTPSKAYQVAQAGRPVLAILHEASTAAAFLRNADAGRIVTFADGALPHTAELVDALTGLLQRKQGPSRLEWNDLAGFTARGSAKCLADAAEEAFARGPVSNGSSRVGHGA